MEFMRLSCTPSQSIPLGGNSWSYFIMGGAVWQCGGKLTVTYNAYRFLPFFGLFLKYFSSLFAQLYNKILQHGAARDVAVVLYHSSEDGQLSHKDDHSRASRDRCVKQIPRKEHRRT